MNNKVKIGIFTSISSLLVFIFSFVFGWGILGDDYINEKELGIFQPLWNMLPKNGTLTYFGFLIGVFFIFSSILLFLRKETSKIIGLFTTALFFLFLFIVLIEEVLVDVLHYKHFTRFPTIFYSIAFIVAIINLALFLRIKKSELI